MLLNLRLAVAAVLLCVCSPVFCNDVDNSNQMAPRITASPDEVSEFERLLNADPYPALASEKLAFARLKQLNDLENKDTSLQASQRFLAFKMAVYALHSPSQSFADWLASEELKTKSHAWLHFVARRVILHHISGNAKLTKQALTVLSKSQVEHSQETLAALTLFVEPTDSHYQALTALCKKACDFDSYHLAMLEYYKATNQYLALEDYSQTLISRFMNKGVWTNDWAFYRYPLAYISFACKHSEQAEKQKAGAELLELATANIHSDSYVYKLVTHAANSSDIDLK